MQSKKSKLFNLVFLLLVFALTIYYVLKGEDMGLILDTMSSAQPFWLACGTGCVVLFIYAESAVTFLQRIALFLTTYFVYRAFGLSEKT